MSVYPVGNDWVSVRVTPSNSEMMSEADGDLDLPPPPPEAVIMSPRPKRRAPPPPAPAPGSLIVMENLEVRDLGEQGGDTEYYDEPPPTPGESRSIISGSVSLPPLPDTPKSKVYQHSF